MTAFEPTLKNNHSCTTCLLAGWSTLRPSCTTSTSADPQGCTTARYSQQPQHHCLYLHAWEKALSSHPDQAYTRYICQGLRWGFRIGFQYGSPLKSAHSNMESADQHPEIISEYLHKECSLSRMLGPFSESSQLPTLAHQQIRSHSERPRKFRLITDLSFPPGQSINDGIDPGLCSLVYTTVDKVASQAAALGRGALLAKVDIEAAYRLIPVHPQDRVLQGMRWRCRTYIDPMLPFGLRSAPKIFNAIADALHWNLVQSGVMWLFHYLDNYIMVAPSQSHLCQSWLDIPMIECAHRGVLIASHKMEGPGTVVTFLGILIDTGRGELRLPHDKLQRLKGRLDEWGDRKGCTHNELESLIGVLNHACKVVRPGRSFLRRMIDLLHAVHRSSFFLVA